MERISKFVASPWTHLAPVAQQPSKSWLVLAAICLLACSACFHKDVMTDRADDVVATLLYQGPEGHLIISKESVFQATSKESGGGVTHISGYTEMRLSCYRIATGELAARVELGDMMEDANELLGYSSGKIWMYSIDPELGLHYRDPLTLEVKEAWPQLSQKPGLNNYKPAHPDWPQISQYFAYDWVNDRLILTDETGFKYALDPNSLALTRVEVDMPRMEWDAHVLSTSGELKPSAYISLEGDPRKVISYLGKKSSGEVSFLDGELLMDRDPHAQGTRKHTWLADLRKHLHDLQDSLARFAALHAEVNAEPNYQTWTWEQRELHDRGENIRREIDNSKRDSTQWAAPYKQVMDSPLLTTDGQSGYILHANLVSDTAHIVVSRVNLAADSTWSIAWARDLFGIYHDVSKADQAGAFETVMSKGNPEFDYQWAATDGTYLVLILQLQMLALDLKSGKLVWKIEI